MRRSALLLLAALLAPAGAAAQGDTPEREVMRVITRLFDGMRAGDSAVVRSVFHPNAQLASVGVRAGTPTLQFDSVNAFVRAVGTPHPDVWDERIANEKVNVDGPLATVWVDYSFYLGQRFSHCGVDAFHLFKGPDGWKIFALADTRRREGCRQ